MSLKDKASLIFKPSRYKSGTAYSFRGEDFTFTRSSVGTRVNSSGEIEEVASGVPRLNYDGTDLTKCPVLLQEYTSTNYLTQSNTGGFGSTDVANATALTKKGIEGVTRSDAGGGNPRIYLNVAMATGFNTFSFYVDAGTITTQLDIRLGIDGNASTGLRCFFYRDSATVSTPTIYNTSNVYSGSEFSKVEHLSGTIYRVSLGGNFANGTNIFPVVYFGSGASNSWIGGGQIERRSYATSLIKTSGSTATRSSDFAESTFADNTIAPTNNTTVYFEVKIDGKIDDTPNTGGINFKNNAGTLNRLNFNYGYNRVHSNFVTGSTVQFIASSDIKEGDTIKVVMQLTQGGKAFVNGKHTHTATRDFSSLTLGQLEFDHSQGVLEYLIFPQILSDAECESLSGYDSYQELVDRNELTWESPTITNNRLTALQEL